MSDKTTIARQNAIKELREQTVKNSPYLEKTFDQVASALASLLMALLSLIAFFAVTRREASEAKKTAAKALEIAKEAKDQKCRCQNHLRPLDEKT
jgi:hypothetical protein